MSEAASFIGTAQPDIYCPGNPDLVCPARALVEKMYSLEPQETVDMSQFGNDGMQPYVPVLPEAVRPSLDAAKMNFKLAELTVAATVQNCGGPTNEGATCPTRETMDNSMVRTSAVRGFRRVFKRINKEEQ